MRPSVYCESSKYHLARLTALLLYGEPRMSPDSLPFQGSNSKMRDYSQATPTRHRCAAPRVPSMLNMKTTTTASETTPILSSSPEMAFHPTMKTNWIRNRGSVARRV
jgi:hypothetical protein